MTTPVNVRSTIGPTRRPRNKWIAPPCKQIIAPTARLALSMPATRAKITADFDTEAHLKGAAGREPTLQAESVSSTT